MVSQAEIGGMSRGSARVERRMLALRIIPTGTQTHER